MPMTVGEHDTIVRKSSKSLEAISTSLRRKNAIEISKELYCQGAISKEQHIKNMKTLMELEGYDLIS